MSVLDPNEILLDGQRYPVLGGVQQSLVSIFPGKVVIGEYSRDTEQLASSYIMEDFKGGGLVYRMDVQRHPDRFWFATCDTRFEKQVFLLPLPTDAGSGGLTGRELRAGCDYGDDLYVAFEEKIRVWNEATPAFAAPAGVVDLDSSATAAVALKLGSTDWLVFGASDCYVRFDGTTWTKQTPTAAIPAAKHLVEWDSRLWALDPQNYLWVTTDLAAANDGWVKKAPVPLIADECQGLLVYFNGDGDPTLHAVARDGLWSYDATNDKWFRTRARWPHHTHGGLGAGEWRGDLFLPAGVSLFRYTGTTLASIGLDREFGLPQDFRGNIQIVADLFNWLGVGLAVDEGSTEPVLIHGGEDGFAAPAFSVTAGFGAIFVWDGTGWHTLWVSGNASAQIRWMRMSVAGGTNRLWWGSNQTAYYVPLPVGVFSPKEVPDWEFAADGYLITPWFDGGWAELHKLAISLALRQQPAGDSQVRVWYATNNADTWTLLGELGTETDVTLAFNDEAGKTFHNIRFKYELVRGADSTAGPTLDFAALKYLRLLDPLYGYTMTVDCSQPYKGRQPAELLTALRDAVESQTLLDLTFRRPDQELVRRKVKVTRFAGTGFTGDDTRGRYQLACVEV